MTESIDSRHRYRILRLLGRGGASHVHLAVDVRLNRKVALKLLATEHLDDADAVRRFRQEALVLASLTTPYTVTVFDSGELDGVPYIAMEVADGTLQDVIERAGAFDAATAIRYMQAILGGLEGLHALGIVHRDVKPQNVLVWRDGHVKLSDLGVARLPLNELTDLAPGTVVGTAAYLSPEQAQGATASAAADLYSAGAVLYTLLTGRVPFEGDDAISVLRRHIREAPTPPSTHAPALPDGLDAVVLRALAKTPSARFESARAFADALAPFAATTGAPAPHAPAARMQDLPTLLIPPSRRRRIGLRGVLAVAVVTAALMSVASLGREGGGGAGPDPVAAAAPAVAVPAVAELHLDAARYALLDSGLRLAVEYEASRRVPEGYVLAQRPAPGTSAAKNSTLTLVVSSGHPRVAVPDVTGADAAAAIETLRAADLRATIVKVISARRKGTVLRQEHRPGARLLEGQVVKLTVSDGPHLTRVPDVVGLPVADARASLVAMKLDVRVAGVPSTLPAGTVVAQSLPAKSRPREGTAIRINVSTGVPLMSVPDVVGVDAESAVAVVRAAGLGVRLVERAVTRRLRHGIVVEQSASAGERLERGAIVTIVVGRFDDGQTAGG